MSKSERAGGAPGRTVVVVPTYNEVENLPHLVQAVRGALPDAGILVVDDASPDGTGALADRLAASDPRVAVLHRAGREGLGRAYLAGFAAALDDGAEIIVEMDADGSHPSAALPRLVAQVTGDEPVAAAIGSRWVPGGRVVDWPAARRLLSRAANAYARIVLRIPVRDSTAGYRAYRADTLRVIDLDGVTSRGYCFQVDMTLRVLDAGLRIAEVPITFTDRTRGSSKMSAGIVVEAMIRVTAWGVARLFGRRRTVRARSLEVSATSPRR